MFAGDEESDILAGEKSERMMTSSVLQNWCSPSFSSELNNILRDRGCLRRLTCTGESASIVSVRNGNILSPSLSHLMTLRSVLLICMH